MNVTDVPVLFHRAKESVVRTVKLFGTNLRRGKGGVDRVNVERDVHRVVTNYIADALHDTLVADFFDVLSIGDVEANLGVLVFIGK